MKCSVVITTLGNMYNINKSIASLESQSIKPHEIIIVCDENNAEIYIADSVISDRIAVLNTKGNMGANHARNMGIQSAKSEYIFLLDDDDEFLPEKIKKVLKTIKELPHIDVITHQVFARFETKDIVWPYKIYHPDLKVDEYLFCRTGFRNGWGLIQTSTLFAKRSLFLEHPFDEDLRKHQDWAWIINISKKHNKKILMIPEVLGIWRQYNPSGRISLSKNPASNYSIKWIESMKNLVSLRAYAGFMYNHVSWQIRREYNLITYIRFIFTTIRIYPPNVYEMVNISKNALKGRIR